LVWSETPFWPFPHGQFVHEGWCPVQTFYLASVVSIWCFQNTMIGTYCCGGVCSDCMWHEIAHQKCVCVCFPFIFRSSSCRTAQRDEWEPQVHYHFIITSLVLSILFPITRFLHWIQKIFFLLVILMQTFPGTFCHFSCSFWIFAVAM